MLQTVMEHDPWRPTGNTATRASVPSGKSGGSNLEYGSTLEQVSETALTDATCRTLSPQHVWCSALLPQAVQTRQTHYTVSAVQHAQALQEKRHFIQLSKHASKPRGEQGTQRAIPPGDMRRELIMLERCYSDASS